MPAVTFKVNGALDPECHKNLYIKRAEDDVVRQYLNRVGVECVYVSLIGARQTGKTSFLNFLHYEFQDWVTVQVDLSNLHSLPEEEWYIQCIDRCSRQMRNKELDISLETVQQYCQRYTNPFSALGWEEFLRLACQCLPDRQYLLLLLDEISSVPSSQRETFFRSIRALHQSASVPNNRPELRKMGIVFAGAFVPEMLIKGESSPFNVSSLVYMSNISLTQLKEFTDVLSDIGIELEEEAVHAIYHWTGGLLCHVQRVCDKIMKMGVTLVTTSVVNEIIKELLFDDTYLRNIQVKLKQNTMLASFAWEIMKKPLLANRNDTVFAELEVVGIIRHDPDTKRWKIVNLLCECFLHNYLEEQPMTGMEIIVLKGVDFLFKEVSKILEERREARRQRGEQDDISVPVDADTSGSADSVTAEEVKDALRPKLVHLKDIPQEIQGCINLIEQYREVIRQSEQTIAVHGGFLLAPQITRYQLSNAEKEVKTNSQRLKNLIENAYGHKIVIVGLE